ncbi:MAG: hypothetical protein WCO60_20155, partial [Verrucomicrobiota bacterium]
MNYLQFTCLTAITIVPLASISGALPGNYDESKVPAYTLPDPLICMDGSKVENAATWRNKRRPEVLGMFESEMYGRTPEIDTIPKFEVLSSDPEALDGKAIRKLVRIWLLGDKSGPMMELLAMRLVKLELEISARVCV